ncbi:MAG: hypothetical protein JWO30_3756 [Fibrobacteres bacterium]|nr:hypothetical protein [Fibrobacterota bacterium]
MALNGIGGGDAGSALDRFQALRDSAKKKLAGADGQTSLADLIKRKQAELGTAATGASATGFAARTSAERIPSKPAAAPFPGNPASAGTTGSAAYGRSGGIQKQDPKPTLGRHVDFMA